MIQDTLKEIGFSDKCIQVYLRLLESGNASARQLADQLNLPRPTVYDALKCLIRNGLVTEKNEDGKKIFGVDDMRNLGHLVESKMEKLATDKKEIEKMISDFDITAHALDPKIKFYSGVEGVKQVLKDLLWHKNIETYTMWPISEMVDVLGVEYLENLNRRRIRSGIAIHGIWPRDKSVDLKRYPFLGIGKGHLRELRFAPKGMTWNMSYWIYADKVAFISSHREGYGFIIHSRDFADLMKAQFEVVWKISIPIKPQPQYTDGFLKTV